jgi:hypothetical protein
VSWWWSVSSEAGYDFLGVSVDDVAALPAISGEVGWTQRSLTVSAGTHHFVWTYAKDHVVSQGADAGYLDQVRVESQGQVATPVISLPGGTYSGPQTVSISCATVGAVIHFTNDGMEPSTASEVYSSPLLVSSSVRINAMAVKAGFLPSPVESQVYYITPSSLTLIDALDLPGGTVLGSSGPAWRADASITHDSVDAGRSGFIGDSSSSSFSLSVVGPVTANWWWKVSSELGYDRLSLWMDGVEMAAISGDPGWEQRTLQIATGSHTLAWIYAKDGSVSQGLDAGFVDQVVISTISTAPTPTISPPGGSFSTTVGVTLSSTVPGSTIRYTLDGSTPTAGSPSYQGPILLTSTVTLQAVAFAVGMRESLVASATYMIDQPVVATPAISPPGGPFAGVGSVSLLCATSGATLRYTLDGSTPGPGSAVYSGSSLYISQSTMVKAKAFKDGMIDSAVATEQFRLCPMLTVSIGSATRAFGEVDPAFPATYAGFRQGDDPSVLGGRLVCTSSATAGSVVGIYPVSGNGLSSSDYAITYWSGTLTVVPAQPIISWSQPAAVPSGTVLGDVQLCASSGVPGSFTYAPAAGTVMTFGSHVLSVLFTPDDRQNHLSATASVTLSVVGRDARLTWPPPAAIAYGTSLSGTQLNASASIPGIFSYNPAAGTILHAGSLALGVVFTPTDGAPAESLSVPILVDKARLVAIGEGKERSYGKANPAFTIIYTGFLAGEGPNVLDSLPVASCTASALQSVGTYPITVSGGADADYAIETVAGVLTITQARPIITWIPPASIQAGTPLGAAQLNARADWDGTITYDPPSGTVLAGGSQLLSCTFVPADANVASARSEVRLQVDAVPASGSAAPVATMAPPAVGGGGGGGGCGLGGLGILLLSALVLVRRQRW